MVTLSPPDFVMVLVIVMFGAFGFALGLIQVVGSLVGVIAGAWVASVFYQPVANALATYLLGSRTAATTLAFALIFFAVNRAFGLGFYLVNRVFHLLSFLPFLKSLNRISGGILGLLEGILLLGVILQFAATLSPLPWVSGLVERSVVAPWLLRVVRIAAPLLPAVLSAPLPTPGAPVTPDVPQTV